MRCPICGAKLKDKKCQYCKITENQVIYASNIEAKQSRLKKEKKEIHTSDVFPKDVNKLKLWIFTIAFGWFGADSFLTGKYVKGMFSIFTFMLLYIFAFFQVLSTRLNWSVNAYTTFNILLKMFSVFGVVTFMFWFVGVIQLITKRYKVPVVLPDEKKAEQLDWAHKELERKIELEKKDIKEKQEKGKKK